MSELVCNKYASMSKHNQKWKNKSEYVSKIWKKKRWWRYINSSNEKTEFKIRDGGEKKKPMTNQIKTENWMNHVIMIWIVVIWYVNISGK